MASGSGTGTPSSGSGSTFAALVDRVETAVDDAGNSVFSTAELGTFLNDAIRDYSQHFPRVRTQEITAVADQRTYDLNAGFLDVISVEWPADQDPPEYLDRRSFDSHDGFWDMTGYYDIVQRRDQTNVSELWISEKPESGEDITVLYQAIHELISDVTSITGDSSVPTWHEHILVKYCIWQCSLQMQMTEQQSPTSNSSLLMSQYASNASRARRDYEAAIQQAIFANEGVSQAVSWYAASGGRIY